MTSKKRITYCSITPRFPAKAYMAILMILYQEEIVGFLPSYPVYASTDEFLSDCDYIAQYAEKNNVSVHEEAILVPLSLHDLFPLKRIYWEKPSVKFKSHDRSNLILNALHLPYFYKMLVTPSSYAKRRFTFMTALPFYVTVKKKEIELFMYESDFPVNEYANQAAIYLLEQPFMLNWKNGEITRHSFLTRDNQSYN